MNLAHEPIAPDIIQALVAKATASGLSLNEYLRNLLGLKDKRDAAKQDEATDQSEDTRLAALRGITEQQAKRPFTNSTDTVKALREARAGAMWGYEPTETNGDQQSSVRLELTQDQLWVQANRENYRGEWVILKDGELVGHSKDGVELARAVRSQGVKSPFIGFIPEEDLPWAGF